MDQGCRQILEDFVVTNLGGNDHNKEIVQRIAGDEKLMCHLQLPEDTAIPLLSSMVTEDLLSRVT